jgi:hypothetical protein
MGRKCFFILFFILRKGAAQMKFKSVFILFAFLLMFSVPAVIAEEKVSVEVKNKSGEEARPDLDTAKVRLTFTDIESGSARIVLTSPERNFFSPTDFPMVEGTKLMDTNLAVENGRAAFDYMFPIRGDYQMTVQVINQFENPMGTYELVIPIPENPDEVTNGVIFISSLALFGMIAGFILAKRRNYNHAF